MIAFRYKLKAMPDEDREESFTVEGTEFPRIVPHHRRSKRRARGGGRIGLTRPPCRRCRMWHSHDADPPRIAITRVVADAGSRLVSADVRQLRDSL
jgi:hypothetical protein